MIHLWDLDLDLMLKTYPMILRNQISLIQKLNLE